MGGKATPREGSKGLDFQGRLQYREGLGGRLNEPGNKGGADIAVVANRAFQLDLPRKAANVTWIRD